MKTIIRAQVPPYILTAWGLAAEILTVLHWGAGCGAGGFAPPPARHTLHTLAAARPALLGCRTNKEGKPRSQIAGLSTARC